MFMKEQNTFDALREKLMFWPEPLVMVNARELSETPAGYVPQGHHSGWLVWPTLICGNI